MRISRKPELARIGKPCGISLGLGLKHYMVILLKGPCIIRAKGYLLAVESCARIVVDIDAGYIHGLGPVYLVDQGMESV